MTSTPDRLSDEQSLIPILTSITSLALGPFSKSFEQKKDTWVLDAGPICGNNINYFAKHAKKLSVCDMFFHLDQGRRKNFPFKQVLHHMYYPSQSFDGILLWDLIDRLEDSEVIELVKLCYAITKPGSFLVLIAHGEQSKDSSVNAFSIEENLTLCLKPKAHLKLPLKIRTNREMINMLAPFVPLKSFLHHKGLREFLIKR